MKFIDFTSIIEKAWENYNPKKVIKSIKDISAKVSTNHVFKVKFANGDFIIAKLSYFGKYEHFKEDHNIINCLAHNLHSPFESFLARSLTKKNELYTYRYVDEILDAWVVFYNLIDVFKKPPRRFNENQISKLGEQLALFHLACNDLGEVLPPSSKTLETDIFHLLDIMEMETDKPLYSLNEKAIKQQCEIFFTNTEKIGYKKFDSLPVFVDWNIGNFSVDENFELYSRWDYDWFRMCSRIMDFYFMSRVVSDVGDRTVFSYMVDPLMEDRFILFLKSYHKVFPLTEPEIRFMKEAYRFFILNYVIKDGNYFFHYIYATKLQKEAFELYFPSADANFNADKILNALHI